MQIATPAPQASLGWILLHSTRIPFFGTVPGPAGHISGFKLISGGSCIYDTAQNLRQMAVAHRILFFSFYAILQLCLRSSLSLRNSLTAINYYLT